jgi:magnesium transporter
MHSASSAAAGNAPVGPVSQFCRPSFTTVSVDDSVATAIAKVRRSAQPGAIFYLYVVGHEDELRGIVSIRNLLLANDDTPVSQVYSPKVVALDSTSPIRRAAEVFATSRFLSLPVVDERGRILGVVHAHEIAGNFEAPLAHEALLENQTRSELFELLGIQAEDTRNNARQVALGRLPWLLVNITGGTLCAWIIHVLGGRLANAVEFLAFVPVLLVVSESIGMQTASLSIANLHRGSKTRSSLLLLKEWSVASLLGITCALLLGGGLYVLKGSFSLSATVALTIFLGCLMVSFVGNVVPYLFHRWKIDPRVAAGPVVLSVADCATLSLYLALAVLLSRLG